jgi:hypothetical protein
MPSIGELLARMPANLLKPESFEPENQSSWWCSLTWEFGGPWPVAASRKSRLKLSETATECWRRITQLAALSNLTSAQAREYEAAMRFLAVLLGCGADDPRNSTSSLEEAS